MRSFLMGIAGAAVLIVGANAAMVTWPAYRAQSTDQRNSKVSLFAYDQYGVNPNAIVLDLWRVDPDASMADVDRTLLDTAKALTDRHPNSVRLAYRGISRFEMEGDYFNRLGKERDWQNPIYTIRTMAENLYTLDHRKSIRHLVRWRFGCDERPDGRPRDLP
jgi:hypothetical protein